MCAQCESELSRIQHPMCSVCGTPFMGGVDHPCGACAIKRPPFDRARAAGIYTGPMRNAILKFKFNFKTSLAKPIGKLMADTLLKEFDAGEINSVMPVPLHKKRLRWRGFNQALILCNEISRHTGLWVDPLTLKRIRWTHPQTRLPLKERPGNVKDAFAVARPDFVKDRVILLVDDVSTSGSTLMECARVLKKAGARRVEALTAAKAANDI